MGIYALALEFGYINPDRMLREVTMEHLRKWSVFFKIRDAESGGKAMSQRHLKKLKGGF